MNSKTNFAIKILLLTLLLIGSLTAAFMMGVFLYIEGASKERVGLLVLGLAFSGLTLSKMIALNRKEIRSRITSVVDEQRSYIASWIVDSQQWDKYRKERFQFDKKESSGYGYVLGGILAFIAGLIGFRTMPLEELLVLALAVFLVFFAIGKGGAMLSAKKKYNQYSSLDHGKVYFGKEVIVFNDQLITLSDFGQNLTALSKENRFGMDVLNVEVRTGFGNKRATHRYMIPVPKGREEEAEKLYDYYTRYLA